MITYIILSRSAINFSRFPFWKYTLYTDIHFDIHLSNTSFAE